MVVYANDYTENSADIETNLTVEEHNTVSSAIIIEVYNPADVEIVINSESESDLINNNQIANETKMATNMPITENADVETFTLSTGVNTDDIMAISATETQTVIINDEDTHVETECLTAVGGRFNGPSGKETYYNLPMNGIVDRMRRQGYSEEEYPYWVRDDGCKMLGDYIMVAANLSLRPRGTILETSLGLGIVCDTGSFAEKNPKQIDIATTW